MRHLPDVQPMPYVPPAPEVPERSEHSYRSRKELRDMRDRVHLVTLAEQLIIAGSGRKNDDQT